MTDLGSNGPAKPRQHAASALLSELVSQQLSRVFKAEDVEEAAAQLIQVTSMGSDQSEQRHVDRFRLAALKQSKGDLKRLSKAVKLFFIDPRDLLMQAGFGADPKAHLKWTATE